MKWLMIAIGAWLLVFIFLTHMLCYHVGCLKGFIQACDIFGCGDVARKGVIDGFCNRKPDPKEEGDAEE